MQSDSACIPLLGTTSGERSSRRPSPGEGPGSKAPLPVGAVAAALSCLILLGPGALDTVVAAVDDAPPPYITEDVAGAESARKIAAMQRNASRDGSIRRRRISSTGTRRPTAWT